VALSRALAPTDEDAGRSGYVLEDPWIPSGKVASSAFYGRAEQAVLREAVVRGARSPRAGRHLNLAGEYRRCLNLIEMINIGGVVK